MIFGVSAGFRTGRWRDATLMGALFGFITFLGAFAHDLSSARDTIEGLMERSVWLGFLVIACIVVVRVWMGLYPPPKPRAYQTYLPQPTYGRPYPGQPLYPQGDPRALPRQHGAGTLEELFIRLAREPLQAPVAAGR